jgi:teichoic acid transport system ATP-binding protein
MAAADPVSATEPVTEPVPAVEPTAAAKPTERVPTVIVDDLRVTYKVYGNAGSRNAQATLVRMLKREHMSNMRAVNAIRGVSFTTYRGESVGLIGRNGSGKSTLLRAIAGLLPPTSGAVYTEGQPSLLGVNAALLNDLSGERNVRLGCLAMGMTPEEADAAYDDIVEFSGLRDHIDLPMRTYSSGMQQRLRFAIAAARSHDVLLIDEALATGDHDFRSRSEERIKQMRDEAGTVFLVSHSLGVVRETCTRAIWLDRGQIRMDDHPRAVIRAYKRADGRVGARRSALSKRSRANRANRVNRPAPAEPEGNRPDEPAKTQADQPAERQSSEP